MSQQDFEQAWLKKFADCLEKIAGETIRLDVMQGSNGLSMESGRQAVIDWSRQAMAQLDALVSEPDRRRIMTGCACHYPKENLREIKEAYQQTGDLHRAHEQLQAQFETMLRNVLHLDDDLIANIVGRGWGSAGVMNGNTITAIKIPKSGNLLEYLQECDPVKKRRLYCHCPRIREVLKTEETLSPTYCYCGAGFYKGIWEEILGQPVEVEVIESILKGDDVCKIEIRLPSL